MDFPRREPDIVRLAEDLTGGLTANPEVFPAPPVPASEIEDALAEYKSARTFGRGHAANSVHGTEKKQDALNRLTRLMKADLRYAEFAVGTDVGRLQLIGWGPTRKPTRNELAVPGQVITLDVQQEGKAWVALIWKPPFDGGAVAAYRIQRRRRENGEWMDVGTSVETAIRLDDQETGVELEYRVIGVNQAGEGPVSNIVRVVL